MALNKLSARKVETLSKPGDTMAVGACIFASPRVVRPNGYTCSNATQSAGRWVWVRLPMCHWR